MAKASEKLSATATSQDASAQQLAAAVARARLLMRVSALTTAIAVAAVLGVIGYRVFAEGGSRSATIANGTVFLPKGARVISTTVSGGRIAVTVDINGASEVRIYDGKTLQQVGVLHLDAQKP